MVCISICPKLSSSLFPFPELQREIGGWAYTASTEAINSTATAISTLPDTAVTSAYATAKVGQLLAK